MALGWFLVGALTTAILSGCADDGEDYGYSIPASHRRCQSCGDYDVSVYIVEKSRHCIKLLFECNNCGRRWTKTYYSN